MKDWAGKLKEDDEWYEVARKAVINTPKSAWEFGEDIVNAAIHPIETGKAMGRIAQGAIEKIPGTSYLTPGPAYDVKGDPARSQDFDAMVGFFKDRYGSVSGFKKALSTDPVGVFADAASVVSGIGGGVRGAAKAAGTVGKLRGAAGAAEKVGKTIQKVGAHMEPTNLVKQAVRVLPSERFYESAVKWNTASAKPGRTGQEVRKALTNTAIDNRIMPTYNGINKLRGMLDKLDSQISDLIIAPTEQGRTINASAYLKHFKDLEKQVWNTSGKPVSAVKEVQRIRKEIETVHGVFMNPETGYISHPSSRKPGARRPNGDLIGFEQLTPEQVQAKKVTIYKDLEKSYEKISSSPASVRAQKAIARGAKDGLAELIPEIASVNKSYQPLIELYKAIDQKAGRISNYDLIPAATTWKAGAGYALTGTAQGAAGGAILGLLDTPRIKAKLAILIRDLQKRGINVKPTDAAIALGLFQSGRAEEVASK